MAGTTFSRGVLVASMLGASLAWPLASVAAAGPAEPVIPSRIEVEDGNKLFLVASAVGVQIYSCNGTAWVFVAPRADLFAQNGQLITSHYAGPTWEARDGSLVVGARVDGVTVDVSAIQWLLLRAVSTSAGSAGGRLAETTFIQRINTTGGLAPAAAECTASTAGTVREVAYTADYTFWKATGRP